MAKPLVTLMLVGSLAFTSCGSGDDGPAGPPVVADGAKVFAETCAACHGPDGEGIENLGKPLPGSAFVASLSDAELVEFIKTGRDSNDPANTTGVNMPARGGRKLSEQDVVDVAAYIRTLS